MNRPLDLEQLERWFHAYGRSFVAPEPQEQANYDLKVLHTEKVCEAIRFIAAEGDPRRLYLAQVAAWCHDLGRFPQFQRYGTFRDSDSVSHSHLSVQVMNETGVLEGLADREREAVVEAVRHHSAYLVPEGLEPLADDLVRLVRDADKMDIWRIFIEFFQAPESEQASAAALGLPDTPGYSDTVLATLGAGRMVQLAQLANRNDFKLLQLSWIYDLNFRSTFRLLRDRRIIEEMEKLLPREPELRSALNRLREYLAFKLA